MRGRKPKLDPDCDALTAKTPADRIIFDGAACIEEIREIGRRRSLAMLNVGARGA